MDLTFPRINPCLWFDTDGEDAARFYCGIFPRSRIVSITRYSEDGARQSGQKAGSVMTTLFELDGQLFTALNGGPVFKINEAVSLIVNCDDQAEVDHYWTRLSDGGDPKAQQCGWLKDRFGVSWQIVPKVFLEIVNGPDADKAARALSAMVKMKKIEIARLS